MLLNREMSFTLEGNVCFATLGCCYTYNQSTLISLLLKGEIYIRYLSYKSSEDLKADLVRRVPVKIDIGASLVSACMFLSIVLCLIITFALA
jgi:hypothetical protein